MSVEQHAPAGAAISSATPILERIKAFAARPQCLLVRELIERYMKRYAGADTTREQRLDVWQRLIGELTLEQVDSDVMVLSRQDLALLPAIVFGGLDHEGKKIFRRKDDKKSAATINRYVVAISAVFTWAIEQRLTPKGWVHPCRGIKRLPEHNERVRYLDDDERARLFAECRASRYARLYALVLMAMVTGARKSELLGLRWRDLDLAGGVATLGKTKNGDRRTLVLLPQLVAELTVHKGDAERFVFGSRAARYLRPASIDSAWRDALARAQIRDFRFHDLRHCCASYLAQAGTPLNVIAEVLGHRKLEMTKRYAHLTTQTKATAMRAALGAIGEQP